MKDIMNIGNVHAHAKGFGGKEDDKLAAFEPAIGFLLFMLECDDFHPCTLSSKTLKHGYLPV